jgi:hypothetical protein
MPKVYLTNTTGQHRTLHYSQLATDAFKAANPAAANRGPKPIEVASGSTEAVDVKEQAEVDALIKHNAQYGLVDASKAPKGFRGLTYSLTDPTVKEEPKVEVLKTEDKTKGK